MVDASNSKIRIGVLVLLLFQNSSTVLVSRYSQGILKESYSSYEVVLVAELIKLFASGYLSIMDTEQTDSGGRGFSKLWWLATHSKKVIVLVVMYSIINIATFYATKRVDASLYTVLGQLKTLTTAVFSVMFLNKTISRAKWSALLLLALGCVLVASPTFSQAVATTTLEPTSTKSTENGVSASTIQGILACLVMVTLSGLSVTYFEKIRKHGEEKLTIWERNFQLALYSAILMLFINMYTVLVYNPMYANSAELVEPYVMFKGWTYLTVLSALIQAFGGLLVAATLKYADAVLKTLATSGSIVISTLIGWWLMGGDVDMFVIIGCVATILAIFDYTLDLTPDQL